MRCSVLGARCLVLRARCYVLVLVLGAVFPAVADACPVCFRDPESPMTAGVIAGVGTLLSITTGVLGGIAVLIRRIVRAERQLAHRSAPREGGQ